MIAIFLLVLSWHGNAAYSSTEENNLSDEQTVAVVAPTSFDNQDLPTNKLSSSGEADQRVLDYWTDERMANAIPADKYISDGNYISNNNDARMTANTLNEEVSPLQVASEPVPAISDLPQTYSAREVTNFSSVNGKVFFTNGKNGRNYECSGAALNSSSKRLVITAGHCVHSGGTDGAWHKNWIFIPGYNNGSRPYGTFQAKTLRTFQGWINNGESRLGFERDVAFVTTYNNTSGQKVVNAVGGYGLTTGGSRNFDVTVFGYPGNLNSGEVMWACWGETTTYTWPDSLFSSSRFPKISGCNFGNGSSGGSWLHDYSNSTGLGHVRSVTSFGLEDNSYIGGPYFDSAVMSMFQATVDD